MLASLNLKGGNNSSDDTEKLNSAPKVWVPLNNAEADQTFGI